MRLESLLREEMCPKGKAQSDFYPAKPKQKLNQSPRTRDDDSTLVEIQTVFRRKLGSACLFYRCRELTWVPQLPSRLAWTE